MTIPNPPAKMFVTKHDPFTVQKILAAIGNRPPLDPAVQKIADQLTEADRRSLPQLITMPNYKPEDLAAMDDLWERMRVLTQNAKPLIVIDSLPDDFVQVSKPTPRNPNERTQHSRNRKRSRR